MARRKSSTEDLKMNNSVDYVIVFRFNSSDRKAASAGFERLVMALTKAGLEVEVRNGNEGTLLVLVRASNERVLGTVVYRSRVKDWLYGIRQAQPDRETQRALTVEPLTESERYRHVYQMITAPVSESGAGITPKHGEWENVQEIFPLHDTGKNDKWFSDWKGKTFLTPEEIDDIRNHFGENIAYYYAFLQSYFTFLIFPATFGLSCWALLGFYSPIYAIVNGLWCIVFVEWWKRQEIDLSIRWGVKGVSSILDKRRDFKHEKEVVDPVTGETVQFFSAKTRLKRQLLQIPFALLASIALGAIIATCFGIEIFISEIYDGPLKSILVFIPTGLLTTLIPTITTILTDAASRLTDYENYETQESHDIAMTQKIFVLNFITSYLPIFLTAFVYVPFASNIVPYLDIFSLTVKPFATDEKQLQAPKTAGAFTINPERLKKQVIYFTVTAQVVNFALETIVPLLKRKGTDKFKEMQSERAARKGGSVPADANDALEEKAFLNWVRHEAELDDYDVTADLREMCVQFGYLSLFSVVWPLVPLSFLVNNWIELRGDFFKMVKACKRPTPQRVDSIGPWIDSLAFLTWLGSITSAALVYMFSGEGFGPSGTPSTIKGWALLLTIFFAEHVYMLLRLAVRTAIGKIDSEEMRKDRAEKYMVRKRYLEETMDSGEKATSEPPSAQMESLNRLSLEDEARKASLEGTGSQERFWGRQRGEAEVIKVGLGLIETGLEGSNETKKSK